MPTKTVLSILICSVPGRSEKLSHLLGVLTPQIEKSHQHVEVLINLDDRRLTIGEKRNRLVRASSGMFVAFVDDDDLVSPNYVDEIVKAIESNPQADVLSLDGVITFDGKNPAVFSHSVQHGGWVTRNGMYFRTPNHLNPVARRHALKVKYQEINHGEDRAWSDAVLHLLEVESQTHGILYRYDYRKK